MNVFFYGLFMDSSVLEEQGVYPSNPRKGYLEDYALKIGNRASLVPQVGHRSYGIVMTVDETALEKLYAEPSVVDYIPGEVAVTLEDGDTVKALCYNLPASEMSGANPAYAASLYMLAVRLRFPDKYIAMIRQMSE